jgi:MFS family permease
MSTALDQPTVVKASKFAIPLLGFLSAVQTVDPGVASTALISASRGLEMSPSEVALAASISTLALAATVITTGLIADKVGRRKALIAALIISMIGDLIVFLAPTTAVYMTGRVIAGIGLGAVYGASFAYIRAVAGPGKVAGAMGVFAATGGATILLFTFAGGALVGIDWRLGFIMISALCLISLPLVLKILPPQKPVVTGKTEIVGQVLLGVGVACVLFGFSRLATVDALTIGTLVGGLAALVGFYVWERKHENRFFPVEILKSRVFIAAILAGFIYNFGMSVGFLQLTNLWQYVNGIKGVEVAAWQVPFSLAGIAAALVLAKLMVKGLSNRTVLFWGGIATTVGFVLMGLLHESTSLLGFLPGMLIAGAGLTAVSLPYGNLIIGEAPAKYFGPVTSSRTTIGQFFYAAGFALSTVMVTSYTVSRTSDLLATDDAVGASQVQQGLEAVNAYAHSGAIPDTQVGKTALLEAGASYGQGFALLMFITAGLFVVAAVGAWLLMKGQHPAPPAPAPQPEEAK